MLETRARQQRQDAVVAVGGGHADAQRARRQRLLAHHLALGIGKPSIAHVFSHFKLELHPRHWRDVALHPQVRDNGDLRWVARAQLGALGIPAPIRRLLEAGA